MIIKAFAAEDQISQGAANAMADHKSARLRRIHPVICRNAILNPFGYIIFYNGVMRHYVQ